MSLAAAADMPLALAQEGAGGRDGAHGARRGAKQQGEHRHHKIFSMAFCIFFISCGPDWWAVKRLCLHAGGGVMYIARKAVYSLHNPLQDESAQEVWVFWEFWGAVSHSVPQPTASEPVSYTHLTLPTILRV